ncbi:39S ribosomal protein L50, mitochondrial [Neolecta irregularis DAH-3]|uniref:39S ribosomal protein L50, mitochondrial n=1 Tax=Neolecta irregularis (strain DAH-3) TaxID=1198029 RepID=A0A1U7LJM1_NEOID|nr:39S ribosomal protein L50, mitochondrial [Neolecta irregularis DAH-3]|eukprot:OLL22844.1 39S ribosomal protein L50, mitochondrial [Neolecta irregularis DAH-3]
MTLVAVQASEQIGRRIPDQVLTRVKDVKALIKFYTTPEKKKSRYLVIDEAILDGTNIRVVENRRKARI